MNLDYVFVKDGNDLESLINAFEMVKDTDNPVVVHIVTQKGKGFALAEKNKETWHWCMPFDIETGKPKFTFDGEDYSSVTRDYLLDKMKRIRTLLPSLPLLLPCSALMKKQEKLQASSL